MNQNRIRCVSIAMLAALCLLLAGSAGASARTITVGHTADADYRTIQEAADAADAGDVIYVWNGSYSENVNVDKPRLTLEGEGADVVTVTAADSSKSVFEVTANYVSISGFAVRGVTNSEMAGIRLTNADYCDISRNNAYRNTRGIMLGQSDDNTLMKNTMDSNTYLGIMLDYSSNNMLVNNVVNSKGTLTSSGIGLYGSSSNILTNNTISYSHINGIHLQDSSNNTLTNNTVNSNSDVGIELGASDDNLLMDNTVSNNNLIGIGLAHSSNNTLINNAASNNDMIGISLGRSSNNNILTSNTVSNNDMIGIHLWSSSNNNTLTSNTVSNNDRGIYLESSSNNNITCNFVQDNTDSGVFVSGSTGNNISYNDIIENGNYNATSGGWEWQFYIEQYQPVEAKHNYWGAGMNNSTIDASIYDDEEGRWVEVEFYPYEVRGAAPTLTWQTEPPTTAGQGSDVTFDVSFSEAADYYIRIENSTGGVVWRSPISGASHAIDPAPMTWTTSADTSSVYYTIIVNINGADNSDTKTVIVPTCATPQLDRVELSPDSADLLVGDTQLFTATCYATDATGGSMISDCTVTWHWRNNGIGMINSSTGPSTGLFTATGVGTTTVIASATCGDITKNDTAIVNVTMPPAVITDTDGDGVPDVWDTDNSTPAGYWVNSDGVGRRWGDMNGDGKLTSVDALMILQAAVESN